ncbi:GntR family transcriptional regulator [Metabacillus sp. KIGAM252]|uniref:GntR family transcriptional regulator n=1 Tax=Metabacillus flavus TaxID=2823519 RepID=A0ABS5LIH8_9BACI|nr:GntR family transcriptional regulator [Metabacillus flavus]MBS2970373.1 GntR family transcriptional regulator [Metabacillus flavus]
MKKIYDLELNKSQKLLVYIFKEMDADIAPISVTLDKLTELSKMNRLTVNNSLKELSQLNLISVNYGKGKASNSYMLNID